MSGERNGLNITTSAEKEGTEITLEEKYAVALRALREIVKRGQEGCLAGYNYGNDSRFYDGYDAGLESAGGDAEACLHKLGEDLKG